MLHKWKSPKCKPQTFSRESYGWTHLKCWYGRQLDPTDLLLIFTCSRYGYFHVFTETLLEHSASACTSFPGINSDCCVLRNLQPALSPSLMFSISMSRCPVTCPFTPWPGKSWVLWFGVFFFFSFSFHLNFLNTEPIRFICMIHQSCQLLRKFVSSNSWFMNSERLPLVTRHSLVFWKHRKAKYNNNDRN